MFTIDIFVQYVALDIEFLVTGQWTVQQPAGMNRGAPTDCKHMSVAWLQGPATDLMSVVTSTLYCNIMAQDVY